MIIMKTISMMLGELDYERSYVESNQDQHFPTMNLIILLLFALDYAHSPDEFTGWFGHRRSDADSAECAIETFGPLKFKLHTEFGEEIAGEIGQTLDEKWNDHPS